MISTRCSQVHSGFSRGLWKLLCGAAVQGLGRVPFVPQKPQTRLYLYMTKINQSTQLKVSSCLVQPPPPFRAFGEFPSASTCATIPDFLQQWNYFSKMATGHKAMRATLTRGHQPLSQNCFPIFSKANGDKEPSSVSARLRAATARLCLLLLFHGLFVPAAFGDRAQTFPLPPHVSLLLVHTLPAVKPYPAEYHVFDINYMSEPHESH